MPAAKPPSGAVTFLFTDIVGSTELWEQHGDAFMPVLQAHNAVLLDAVQRNGGTVMKFEGDAYKVVFENAGDAVKCALLAQTAIQRYPWPQDVGAIRVRMAVHTGTPIQQGQDYFGPPLNRAARILSTAHGGQILLSEETVREAEGRLDPATRFHDLGHHELRDLGAPIRLYQADHPALVEAKFPPPKSLNGHAHNMPVQRTSFIGREKELEQIAALLTAEGPPLLTLTGQSGIGKTRLSLQAAAERIEWFPDGVWYAALSEVSNAEQAARVVADALGLSVPEGSPAVSFVREWLARRQCLLILDDCGNAPEVGAFIRELLSGASSLRCLATARDSLRIQESTEVEVPEMALPPENATPAEVAASESGQLFVERANEVRPGFSLNDSRAKSVSSILRKVGGVPGAIVRMAERMRSEPADAFRTLAKGVAAASSDVAHAAEEALGRAKEAPAFGQLLENMGTTLADANALALSERALREALEAYQKSGNRPGVAGVLHRLGGIAARQNDHGRASMLLGAAHQIYVELGSERALAVRADMEEARRHAGTAGIESWTIESAIDRALGRAG